MSRTAAQVRQEFIAFFRDKHGHAFVPSSPVVPHDDPTLLFTNAGMNQFKPYFLGTETPKHRRVANTQKCIRAGGKHNDLDDVGHDTYHHTFFEMLGNWSFGDYFKKEAIAWAWELLVDVWGLDPERLHATFFGGDEGEGLAPDTEARDLWLKILPPERVHPGNKKDNFWEMGETGPCGPCSEIHIDLTPDKTGGKLVNAGDARAIEIWNLVFIQFNRDTGGKLTPLPAKHVDTGMGFERVTAVLQGHNNNYATDVFVPIIQHIERISGHTYGQGAEGPRSHGAKGPRGQGAEGVAGSREEPRASHLHPPPSQGGAGGGSGFGGLNPPVVPPSRGDGARTTDRRSAPSSILHPQSSRRYAAFTPGDMRDEACRVIADHIRTLTFALTDGAVPDKEGRGYVLRRILRRAVRFGWQYLNLHEPFLCDLVDTVVATMGDAFPELRKNPQHVKDIIRDEEESFERTLGRGIELFAVACMRAVARAVAHSRAYKWEGSTAAAFESEALDRFVMYFRDRDGAEHAVELASLSRESIRQVGAEGAEISGEDAFKLHDTYGFPIDLTQVMAEEHGLKVNIEEYERLMEEARERARGARAADEGDLWQRIFAHDATACTSFCGYDTLGVDDAIVEYVCAMDGVERSEGLRSGEPGILVLDKTPFYAEAGGQVGDRGIIRGAANPPDEPAPNETDWEFRVEDTSRVGDAVVHRGTCIRGPIQPTYHSQRVSTDPQTAADLAHRAVSWVTRASAEVTESSRRATMQNHTATHVLNWALREVLGDHVQQKGSLVDPEKTRFDFSHPRALTSEELERIETLVNKQIAAGLPVDYQIVPQHEALRINGLRAVFGERYPDEVRVMSIGKPVADLLRQPDNPEWRKYSIEFCGGTHLSNTAQIEHFVITHEEAVAKGIRRVVGITGARAAETLARGDALIARADALKKAPSDAVAAGLVELQSELAAANVSLGHRARLRELFGELQGIVKAQHKADAADAAGVVQARVAELLATAEKRGETTIVVAEMPDVPVEQLKGGADTVKQKCGSAAVLFGVRSGDKAVLLAAVSPDLVKKGVKAGDLVKEIAKLVGGGGGGPPTMAQAGGKHPEKLPEALAAGQAWLEQRL